MVNNCSCSDPQWKWLQLTSFSKSSWDNNGYESALVRSSVICSISTPLRNQVERTHLKINIPNRQNHPLALGGLWSYLCNVTTLPTLWLPTPCPPIQRNIQIPSWHAVRRFATTNLCTSPTYPRFFQHSSQVGLCPLTLSGTALSLPTILDWKLRNNAGNQHARSLGQQKIAYQWPSFQTYAWACWCRPP